MVGIPRFNAQIRQLEVPRMKDFEYAQNRSIYETMKKAGEQISNTFFEMVAQGDINGKSKKDESEQYQLYRKAVGYDVG